MDDPNNLANYPEGATPLDRDELAGIKHRYVTTRRELDHLEQSNILEGLAWLRKQKSPKVLSDTFVQDLHRRLFGKVWKWAGSYRKTEKNIGVTPYRIPMDLRQLLDDAQFWVLHSTYPPKELAARFHHRLVAIHPFPNGNGRHARIMANAMLTHLLKEQPIDWGGGYSLEQASERRSSYIAALRSADVSDYKPLLVFVGATNEAD